MLWRGVDVPFNQGKGHTLPLSSTLKSNGKIFKRECVVERAWFLQYFTCNFLLAHHSVHLAQSTCTWLNRLKGLDDHGHFYPVILTPLPFGC